MNGALVGSVTREGHRPGAHVQVKEYACIDHTLGTKSNILRSFGKVTLMPTSAPGLGLPLLTSATAMGSPLVTSAPELGSPLPTSAPRLGAPLPHLHRDWARILSHNLHRDSARRCTCSSRTTPSRAPRRSRAYGSSAAARRRCSAPAGPSASPPSPAPRPRC